jgi:hypothetical protein
VSKKWVCMDCGKDLEINRRIMYDNPSGNKRYCGTCGLARKRKGEDLSASEYNDGYPGTGRPSRENDMKTLENGKDDICIFCEKGAYDGRGMITNHVYDGQAYMSHTPCFNEFKRSQENGMKNSIPMGRASRLEAAQKGRGLWGKKLENGFSEAYKGFKIVKEGDAYTAYEDNGAGYDFCSAGSVREVKDYIDKHPEQVYSKAMKNSKDTYVFRTKKGDVQLVKANSEAEAWQVLAHMIGLTIDEFKPYVASVTIEQERQNDNGALCECGCYAGTHRYGTGECLGCQCSKFKADPSGRQGAHIYSKEKEEEMAKVTKVERYKTVRS